MGTVPAQPVPVPGLQLSLLDLLEMEDALRPLGVMSLPRPAREHVEAAWLQLQQWKRESLRKPSSGD